MRRSIETIIETIWGKTKETGDKAHADGSPLTESTQFALSVDGRDGHTHS